MDLVAGNVPTGTTAPIFDVMIPPQGGHGADIYRELAQEMLLFILELVHDTENPDFITGNEIARVGLVQNPKAYNASTNLELDKGPLAYAL